MSLVIVALLAVAVAGVSSASAAQSFTTPSTNPTVQRNWGTGAKPGLKLTGSRAVQISLASEKLTFDTTIGGLATEFTASGLECSNCKIENRAGTGENVGKTEAVFSGTLSLSGLHLVSPEPTRCSLPSTLTTKPVVGVLGGEKGGATKVTFRLSPTEGSNFANVEISGANCPIAGIYKWTGNAFGEFINSLGVGAKTQRVRLSKAIQENLGTPTALKFGENPVSVAGELNLGSEVEFEVRDIFDELFTTPSTNPTVPRNWYTGAQPGTKLIGTRAVHLSLASEKLTFETSLSGTPWTFSASGLECPNCKIENREGTGENKGSTEAVFSGEITLTGVKWLEPEPVNCSTASTLKLKPITAVVGGQLGSSTVAAVRFSPTESTIWASYELTGAKCPIAGVYKWTGNAFGEFANSLGVPGKTQRVKFSRGSQEVLGTPSSLKFGEASAFLVGEVNMSSEVEFQVKEK